MIKGDQYRKLYELIETESEREWDLKYETADMYGIYQIMDQGPSQHMKFMDMDFFKKHGEYPKREGYLLVYTAPLSGEETLDSIYIKFNIGHPKDYYGHSLSVSDVIVIQKRGKVQAFYVDSIGYKEIPEFFRQGTENPPEDITHREPILCGHFHILLYQKRTKAFIYTNMQEAFDAYFSLPMNTNKRLIFKSFLYEPLLLLVQCQNQMDMLGEGNKQVKNRKNPNEDYLIEKTKEYLHMNEPEEMAFRLPGKKGYFLTQTCEDGFDFTLYDADYKEIDGGQWDVPIEDGEIYLMSQAVKAVLEDYGIYSENLEMVNYQKLLEKVEEVNRIPFYNPLSEVEQFRAETERNFHPIQGKSPSEIEQYVLAYTLEKIAESGLEVDVTNVVLFGSRSRGKERPDSDLDIVLEYQGDDVREDILFNLLHEDNFKIGSVLIDINPILEVKSGTLEQYLKLAESYLRKN